MHARPLGRDDVKAVRWEHYEPEYRVDFWHQLPPPEGAAAETMGYKQDSYRVSEVADVHEVLDWAQRTAAGRRFVVYATYTAGGERGIIRVHGADPTHSS